MLNTGQVIGEVIGGRYITIAFTRFIWAFSEGSMLEYNSIYNIFKINSVRLFKPMQRIQFFFQVSNSHRYQS